MLKMRAAQAEALVENILASDEYSEYAKSQLHRTSVSAKHLEDLISNIQGLEVELQKSKCNYSAVGNLLVSANKHVDALQCYQLIPKVNQLFVKLNTLKENLQDGIFASYREIGLLSEGYTQSNDTLFTSVSHAQSTSPVRRVSMTVASNPYLATYAEESARLIESLADSALVVEQLGHSAVHTLMVEIVQRQMIPYEQAGRPGGELFSLTKDCVERRWSLLRKLVADTDTRMVQTKACLKKWMLPHRLYLSFAQRTAIHFRGLLQQEKVKYETHAAEVTASMNAAGRGHGVSDDVVNATVEIETQEHVALLVNVLKSSLAFEAEMSTYFEDDMLQLKGSTPDEEEVLSKLTEGNMISEVLDDYMDPYVKLAKKNLEETIRKLIAEDIPSLNYRKLGSIEEEEGKDAKPTNRGLPGFKILNRRETDKSNEGDSSGQGGSHGFAVEYGSYPSAGKMFELIKGSMKRVLTLSKGRPFYLLIQEYRWVIQIYANALKTFCPTEKQSILSGVSSSKARPRITVEQQSILCRVLNTADYCADVIPKLQEILRDKISYKYISLVEFSNELDKFHDVIAYSNDILVGGTMEKVDAALTMMRKSKWGELEAVGDESPYMMHLTLQIIGVITRLRSVLAVASFNHFCLSFMAEFLDCYLAVIMSQKYICPVGAEQLLLDLNSLKGLFSRLHHVELAAGSPRSLDPIPGPYNTVCSKKFRHIETVLKLICVEDDQFEEMFGIMWPDYARSDMMAIRDLKNKKRLLDSATDVGASGARATKHMVGAVGGSTKRAVGAVGGGSKKAFDSVRRASVSAIGKLRRKENGMTDDASDDGEEPSGVNPTMPSAAPAPKSRLGILGGNKK